MNVTIKRVPINQKPPLRKLMESYFNELSKYFDGPLNVDEYKYLDLYWVEKDRIPYLLYLGKVVCGFALVNSHVRLPENKDAKAIAEFYILKEHRNRSIGKTVAFQLFNEFPGKWEVAVAKENTGALKFWEKVINEYTEGNFSKVTLDDENWKGPVYSFSSKNDLNH